MFITLLDKLSLLLQKDVDDLMKLHLEMAINYVCEYCNIDEISDKMQDITLLIAQEIHDNSCLSGRFSMGDITFMLTSNNNLTKRLNAFRRLKW